MYFQSGNLIPTLEALNLDLNVQNLRGCSEHKITSVLT
jgi:hypothetical protein